MSILSLNLNVLFATMAEGAIAFDIVSKKYHELSSTAALLVGLSDGKRTRGEIVMLATEQSPKSSELSILESLEQVINDRILIESAKNGRGDIAQNLTANELDELSYQLRDEGNVPAAYLCQRLAVELNPNESEFLRELGELAHIIGKRVEARQAFESYLLMQPDDAEIRHLLTSFRGEPTPARVPDECIRQLYRRFSSNYEENMVGELQYAAPRQLRNAIDRTLGNRKELSVLELGCGTGLAGVLMAERSTRLVGIDLSPEMIAKARQRGIYHELHVAELTSWLDECNEQYDLVVACDTFIYFGDLHRVIGLATKATVPGGLLVFSVERAESGTFGLTDNGRFVHHADHILAVARSANLEVVEIEKAFVRMEYGEEVTGLVVVLRASTG